MCQISYIECFWDKNNLFIFLEGPAYRLTENPHFYIEGIRSDTYSSKNLKIIKFHGLQVLLKLEASQYALYAIKSITKNNNNRSIAELYIYKMLCYYAEKTVPDIRWYISICIYHRMSGRVIYIYIYTCI